MHQSPLPRRIAWFAPWTWKRRWWIALVLAGLMVGYPLSTGPVYRLAMDRRIPVQTFVEIYRPLWWLESRIPGLDKIMDWYLQQFIKS